tara:strand:+ start:811 stop:1167 length:357 start_codon:yes stop_codon:yes gene_type:complete
MAQTFSKALLSGSTQGKPISVTGANSGAAVTVHTAVAGTTHFDEVYVYATNVHTAAVTLTIEFGGTDENEHIMANINPNETVLVIPGLPIHNGLAVKAFASVADEINVAGYVNKITVT